MKPSEIVRHIASELRAALRNRQPICFDDAVNWAFLLQDIAPEIEAMEARTRPCDLAMMDHGDNVVAFRPRSSLSDISEAGEGSA